MPSSERDILSRTEEFNFLPLERHDLPESAGFVEPDGGRLLTRPVEHGSDIPHYGPLWHNILHFVSPVLS